MAVITTSKSYYERHYGELNNIERKVSSEVPNHGDIVRVDDARREMEESIELLVAVYEQAHSTQYLLL